MSCAACGRDLVLLALRHDRGVLRHVTRRLEHHRGQARRGRGARLRRRNILFPLAYLLADVLTEVYGFRAARRIILLGFACNVLAVVTIQLALRLPAADFWAGNQEAYETILGTTWRIFVASLVAYLVGELTNSYVLSRMKVATGGRFLWSRTIGSSVVGQALDSTIFVTIAFGGTGAPLLDTIVTTWAIKVAWEVVATPFTYLIANGLKRAEGIDVFDR